MKGSILTGNTSLAVSATWQQFNLSGGQGLRAAAGRWWASRPPGVMHAMERVFKFLFQSGERSVERRSSGNQYIIEAATRVIGCQFGNCGFEASPNSVANNRAAKLLCNCEPEARPSKLVCAR